MVDDVELLLLLLLVFVFVLVLFVLLFVVYVLLFEDFDSVIMSVLDVIDGVVELLFSDDCLSVILVMFDDDVLCLVC